jgi:hypothetical protein
VALCAPAVSLGQTPTQDSVVATGAAAGDRSEFYTVDINVQSGPSGENATGHVKFSGAVIGRFRIPIDADAVPSCLNVVGTTAVIYFPTPGTATWRLRLVDNGPANSAQDTLTFDVAFTPVPPGCPADIPLDFTTGVNSFSSGDVVVVDAQRPPPLPTSRDQCKDGGWQQYDFKNQGQCVAFVNREARS